MTKVQGLQDELRKKDMNLAAQESKIKELEETAPIAGSIQRPIGNLKPVKEPEIDSSEQQNASALDAKPPNRSYAKQTESDDISTFEKAIVSQSQQGPKRSGTAEPKLGSALDFSEPGEKDPVVNFNAQDLTAAADGANGGTLSFRLVKDQPDIRFSGYLFVFVEMSDPRGENKIYVYPKTARLGDEDLPADYRAGETLSFKYNSRVELPYSDIRSGASLVRVSILLYGDNGKIVFQRGFERKEVKAVSAKAANTDTTKAKTSEKRRAL